MSNVHRRRVNSPFNKEQEIWIILEFGSVRNISTVRRNFRKEFKITNVKLIPQRNVFQRLVDRFIDQSDTKPVAKTGGKMGLQCTPPYQHENGCMKNLVRELSAGLRIALGQQRVLICLHWTTGFVV